MYRRALFSAGLVFAIVVPLWADDKPKRQESANPEQQTGDAQKQALSQLQKLMQEHQNRQMALSREFRSAKTAEEKQKIREKAMRPSPQVGEIEKIANDHPKTEVAEKALFWLARMGPFNKRGEHLMQIARDHSDSKDLVQVLPMVGMLNEEQRKEFLDAAARSPHIEVKGAMALSKAQSKLQEIERANRNSTDLTLPNNDDKFREVVALFELVKKDYANVKLTPRSDTLGKQADDQIFVIQNLMPGKTVPEIQGPDVDGKEFKLSEYRGIVVMLDFWGFW